VDISLAWLIAGFILIIVELVTGTFYLLVLGIAALVGAGVGYASGAFVWQAVAAAVVAVAVSSGHIGTGRRSLRSACRGWISASQPPSTPGSTRVPAMRA